MIYFFTHFVDCFYNLAFYFFYLYVQAPVNILLMLERSLLNCKNKVYI